MGAGLIVQNSRVLGMIIMIPVTRAHAAEEDEIRRAENVFGEVSRIGQQLDRHQALDRRMAGRTTFIVAHRLGTLRRADRVIVLDMGRITESGEASSVNSAAREMCRKK